MMVEEPKAELLLEDVARVSQQFEESLFRHLSKILEPKPLSRISKAAVTKRVPPKKIASYIVPDQVVRLLAMEISDIGTRISRYQYIERYREYFSPPNAEFRTAFINHMHFLRGSEIYVIMERCSSFLDFLYNVATDLNLQPVNCKKECEKQFKKSFERHLRERHRIVHVHERPSLVSRMTEMPTSTLRNSDIQNAYAEIIAQLLSRMPDDTQKKIKDLRPEEALKFINELRLKAVDGECAHMWSIFVHSLAKTIDLNRLAK